MADPGLDPDLSQRTQFAAGNLLHALNAGDEAMAAAMCSYLAIRLPELKQVKIEDDGELIELETADGDRGRVIGRQGRVAKALRAILNATADGAGARLDIVD